MKKNIFLLFSLLLCSITLQLHAEIGKGSISFTSKKAVNSKIKVTVETGSATKTKMGETFTVKGAKVKSAKGGKLELIIEKSEALITLNGDFTLFKCEKAELTTLKLENAKKLQKLYCKRNNLKELDVTYLNDLVDLDCCSNQIATMDLEACEKLKKANFSSNSIKNLYLPESNTLTYIDCSINPSINDLDVSKCKGLKTLKCYSCGLGEKKIDKLVEQLPTYASPDAKIYIRFGSDGEYYFTKQHIKQLKEKGWIAYDSNNQLCEGKEDWGIFRFETSGKQSLYFCSSPTPGLNINLFFSEGVVYDPTFSYGNKAKITCTKAGSYTAKCKFSKIWFDGIPDKITMVDLSGQPYLKEFSAKHSGITKLLLSENVEKISVTQSGWLTNVIVPKNNHLISLNLSENISLTTLDLSNCSQLEQLDIRSCNLEQIKLTGCKQLKKIQCCGNHLKTAAFNQIISDLADHSGESGNKYSIVLHSNKTKEWNYCTIAQVEALREKGWTVLEIYNGKESNYTGIDRDDPYIDKKVGDNRFGTDRISIHFNDNHSTIYCKKLCIDNKLQTLQDIKDNENMWVEGAADIRSSDIRDDEDGICLQSYKNNITLYGKITEIKNLGYISDNGGDIDASQASSLKRLVIDNPLYKFGIKSLKLPKGNALTELNLSGISFPQFDVSNCTGLKNVTFYGCKFKYLDFSNAKNLEKAILNAGSESVSFAQNGKLKELQLIDCYALLTSVGIPESVENLCVTRWQQEKLPELPSGLRILDCNGLDKLTSIPALPASLTEMKFISSNVSSFDFTHCKELTTLTLEFNPIHSIKFPTESKLKTISIANNSISEKDMTTIIEALPKVNNGTLMIWAGDGNSANYCNSQHVAAAKAKGWNVIDWRGNPYPGMKPTGISNTIISKEDKAPYYDLQGRIVERPTQSGIYIHNGKKIFIK